MSEEFELYELKELIEKQKERIDSLVELQSRQGLNLQRIEYFNWSLSLGRPVFLNKIKNLIGCSSSVIEEISKEIPDSIEYKCETYQKGSGYYDPMSMNEHDQLYDGYNFLRETTRKIFTNGKVSESVQDDRYYDDCLFNIPLDQYLSKEELSKVSDNIEEYATLRARFCDGKFLIAVEGNEGRELFQIYSVGIFDAVEMKKYVYLEEQMFANYFERTYFMREKELGFTWRRHIKDFITKRTQNIAQIKLGMEWFEVNKLLGDPVLKYPDRGGLSIKFYWVDIPWPNELKDDYMIPLIFQREPKEKINEYDLDYKTVLAGQGWDYLETLLKK